MSGALGAPSPTPPRPAGLSPSPPLSLAPSRPLTSLPSSLPLLLPFSVVSSSLPLSLVPRPAPAAGETDSCYSSPFPRVPPRLLSRPGSREGGAHPERRPDGRRAGLVTRRRDRGPREWSKGGPVRSTGLGKGVERLGPATGH